MNNIKLNIEQLVCSHQPPSYQIFQDIVSLKKSSNAPIARLCSNESPLGLNPVVKHVLSKWEADLSCYPDPTANELRKTLAIKHQLDPQMLLIGNGSTEILELITRSHLKRDEIGIISEYSYPLYALLVKNSGGCLTTIPTKTWEYDLEEIHGAIDANTRMIFLANPNNPTGAWISIRQLEKFMHAVPKHVLVVIDEAYYDFMEREPCYSSAIALVNKYANLVVTRTFSKAYGLAGLRVGYAVAHPHVIQKALRFKQSANVGVIAQAIASRACTDEIYRQSVIEEVNKNRELFFGLLKERNMRFVPTKTNFLLIRTKERTRTVYEKLTKHRVIVQPLELYNIPFYIRVSIGKVSEIHQFFSALDEEKTLC